MSERGFSLAELLIAAALVLLVAAALALLSNGMRRAFDASLDTIDLTARGRAGLASLAGELQAAGSGVAIGPSLQRLSDLVPVVLPRRSLADPTIATPFTALTVTRATGAQAMLLGPSAAGTMAVQLDSAAPSARQDGTAGLQAGDIALVFDTARAETVTVAGASAWTVTLQSPLRATFAAGALIAGIERTTYGVRSPGGSNARLVRRTAAGAEQPIVDHVGTFEVFLWGVNEPPQPSAVEDWFPTFGPLAPLLGVDDGRDVWAAGENCSLATDGGGLRVSRLPQLGPAGLVTLLSATMLSDGPWCADPLDAERFDADLLRLSRVDVRLDVLPPPRADRSRITPITMASSIAVRER